MPEGGRPNKARLCSFLKGIPPIIEAESPVGPHFIFQADEELRGLLDFGATVTSSGRILLGTLITKKSH